jgi:hypothetical protein
LLLFEAPAVPSARRYSAGVKVFPGEPFDLDTAALAAVGRDAGEVLHLAVRDAEVADVLAVSGLLAQPPATAEALRLLARARPGRAAVRWNVS